MSDLATYITSTATVCHGKLTFRGTRVMVWQVLDALANGESYEAILDAWPSITKEHIHAALRLPVHREA
ncbi:MAG: DUF433 domain-containing protein [bacterium]|nr:DUF433 domain-containing protein [bacterium]